MTENQMWHVSFWLSADFSSFSSPAVSVVRSAVRIPGLVLPHNLAGFHNLSLPVIRLWAADPRTPCVQAYSSIHSHRPYLLDNTSSTPERSPRQHSKFTEIDGVLLTGMPNWRKGCNWLVLLHYFAFSLQSDLKFPWSAPPTMLSTWQDHTVS